MKDHWLRNEVNILSVVSDWGGDFLLLFMYIFTSIFIVFYVNKVVVPPIIYIVETDDVAYVL